jgi:hypothetical protein
MRSGMGTISSIKLPRFQNADAASTMVDEGLTKPAKK